MTGRPAVLLEPSYFYPTSGGQPHDTGTLRRGDQAARVIDVIERESDGAVLHVLDKALGPGPATATIDRDRRLDRIPTPTSASISLQRRPGVAQADVGFDLSRHIVLPSTSTAPT